MARAALVLTLVLGVAVPAFGFDFSFGAKDVVSQILLRASNIIRNPVSPPEQQRTEVNSQQEATRFRCPSALDGLYPNYEDCSTFFQCAGGQPYLKQCPSNLHYNRQTQRCDYPCEAHCDQRIACQCKWPSCNNLCYQPREPGTCDRELKRYFYNTASGQCEPFIYTGCKGNQNNFKTLEKCRRTCDSEQVSPPDVSIQADGSKVQNEFKCTKDGLFPNPKECWSFYECKNGRSKLMQCPGAMHFNSRTERCEEVCNAYCDIALTCDCNWYACKDACDKPLAIGTCGGNIPRYYYNKESKQCEMFYYGGCDGNENNFGTQTDCEISCTNLCELPASKGPCDGNYEMWYFDSKEQQCKTFIYGGCEGNINRFDSGVLCYDFCVIPFRNRTHSDSPQPTMENSELMPMDTVPQLSAPSLDFRCDRDGQFQNTHNCSTFIDCSNGQASLKKCPSGLHFSVGTKRCESPCEARCDQTLEEECCWNDVPIHTDTHAEEPSLYSASNEETVQVLRSTDNEMPDLSILEQSEPMMDIVCKKDGMYPNPLDCSTFAHCSNGHAYLKHCPEGLHFSVRSMRCEEPCDAKCDKRLAKECNWTPEEDNFTRCRQPPAKGNCDALQRRYYFDFNTGECKDFIYSGCRGNSNNFRTMKECEDTCLIERNLYTEVCTLPAEKGPCSQNIKRYYYDAKTGSCKRFQYGGCEGNGNNFEKLDMCVKKCIDTRLVKSDRKDHWDSLQSIEAPTESPLETAYICENSGFFPHPTDCGRFIQCDYSLKAYVMLCPTKLHFNTKTRTCTMPCDAHCNKSLACKCGWPECSEVYVNCEARPSVGPCQDYQDRYFYNRYIGKCEKFSYGGCGGNTNNFIDPADCKIKCIEKMLDGFRCPRPNGKFSDFFDCITYYDCKNGIPTRKRCPDGLAFDHIKSTCVIEYEAVCMYKCRDRDAVYTYQPDCHKYIDCVNGIAKVESCKQGTAFDFSLLDCVDEKLVC